MRKPKIDPAVYPVHVFDLIVLHKPKDTRTLPNGLVREIGKAPLYAQWQTMKVDSAGALRKSARDGNNVGVRLKDTQLVIDVDPRNGGDNGFLSLCADAGLDFDKYPHVKTGSGGMHVYMAKPADMLVMDTLQDDDYEGVEFKSKGRQVVAAGSVHPNGNYYKVDDNFPTDFASLPMAPKRLLTLIRRAARSVGVGGGELTPDKLAKLLENLDASQYDSNDKWFPILAASHHATAGEGRQEFVEWSTSDPQFSKLAFEIGKRWDSLHAEKNNGFTLRTLNRELRGSGSGGKQVATRMAEDEFPDDAPTDDTPPKPKSKKAATKKALESLIAEFDGPADDDEGEESEELDDWLEGETEDVEGENSQDGSLMRDMLSKYYALIDGGKFRILTKEYDPEESRDRWVSMDAQSFQLLHGNQRVEVDKQGKSKNAADTIKLGQAWLEHPHRKNIRAVIFDPMSPKGEKDGFLNMFQGWAYEPSPKGSWKHFREMIFEVIAAGDDKVDAWIMNWLAHMFQKPNVLPQSAIVMIGDQGLGKGTFGNTFVKLVGQHAHAIGSGNRLTGRFNAHLRNLIFLFADEVTNPYKDGKGDTSAANLLKNMITEPRLEIERKGVDTIPVRNLLHLVMATNDKWVIPAEKNERRYMVTQVSDVWRGKHDKWDKLHAELSNGGLARMLYDLMDHDIPGSYKPNVIHETEGLSSQKTMTFGPIAKFLHQWLDAKSGVPVVSKDWEARPFYVFCDDFLASYQLWCKEMGIRPYSSGRYVRSEFFKEVASCFETVQADIRKRIPNDRNADEFTTTAGLGMTRALMFPPLNDTIEEFERAMRLTEGTIPRPAATDSFGEFG